jgi:hypothetical protein
MVAVELLFTLKKSQIIKRGAGRDWTKGEYPPRGQYVSVRDCRWRWLWLRSIVSEVELQRRVAA